LKWLTTLLLPILLSATHAIGQISVKTRQVDARRVMNAIEQQSDYRFVYDESSIQFPTVDVELTNASVEQALSSLFANTSIDYKIVKKTILLKRTTSSTRPVNSTNGQKEASQRYTFTGNVQNAEGVALAGASVRLKNTDKATSTEESGYFVLESETQTGTIQISFVGYETIELSAKQQMGTIVLPMLASEISEVTVNVNTGYQSIPKERATGAFGSLPKESLEQQRLNYLNTLLVGRIAGNHDGRIRGTTSMNGVTDPLFVVDGFPIETSAIQSNGNIEEALPNLNLE